MNFQIGEKRTIPTDVTEKGVPTDTNSTIVMHETENQDNSLGVQEND